MMTFGSAFQDVRDGLKVARKGWNGKGMYIFLTGAKLSIDNTSYFIALKTADDKVTPWQPSQTDMLADDWIWIEDQV